MNIGELAHVLGVSRITLRRWEEAGKPVPKAARDRNGHRFWREDDVPKFKAWMESERGSEVA